MLTYKVSEIYNTRYYYRSLVVDLNYLFSNLRRFMIGEDFEPNIGCPLLGELYSKVKAGEKVQLDLASCVLSTDACNAIITAQYSGILFCDSSNCYRDDILKTNIDRLSEEKTKYLPIPILDYRASIKEYIRTLDTNVVYNVMGMPDEVMVALVCVVTILRPKVQLCIDTITNKLFMYIAVKMTSTALMKDTEFYLATDYGVVDVTDADNIYVQELQDCVPVREAVKYGIIVPKKFGRDVLINDPDYTALFNSSIAVLEEYQNSRPKRLYEIYGGENNANN